MDKTTSLKNSILIITGFVVLIWWIKMWEDILGWDLHQLGVYPQTLSGLVGIVTGPLIHGSWQHAIGNTLPLLLLGSILIYGYPKSRWWTLAIIWLFSGIGVWVFARNSFHFGASGLTHGMFFYLFTNGILRRDKRSTTLLMVAFFMYGGMLLTIFPREPEISYEYHFFGALGGFLCAIIFRRWDPKPTQKAYSWEQQVGEDYMIEEEDLIIGDQWKTEKQKNLENSKTTKDFENPDFPWK
ncbi:MAG: rhomboid family intramembrane serine protease [Gammaproteobacteria bacterium]|nr:MAG: rhomboid family intramembrane serine protease [Gammaproteobacteria bacterium]